MKKVLTIILLLTPLALEAQPSKKTPARRASSGGRQAPIPARAADVGTPSPAVPAQTGGQAAASTAATPAGKAAFEGTEITKYNASDLYAKCMSKTCFDPKTGLCQCRDGSERFGIANAECRFIAAALPFKEADVLADFGRRAANDCTGFVFAENAASAPKTQSEALASLTVCMKKACKSRGGGDFEICFDDDALAAKFKECKDSYANYNDPEALKLAFRRQIGTYKAYFCSESWGVMRDGECFVRIGIGTTPQNVKGVREFRVGENIICSQEAFGARVENAGYEIMRMTAKKDIITGSMRLVGSAASAAGSIVGTSSAGTGEKTALDKISTTLAVTNAVTGLAGDSLGIYINSTILGAPRPEFKGICFAVKTDGQAKPIFHEDPDVFYQLRYSLDWEERGRSTATMK